MSAAIHNYVVADATTSTFDQVKQGAIDAGNWVGRQVQWLFSAVKDLIMKIIETVKPFFSAVVNFIQEQSVKIRDFLMANKELSIGLGIAIPVIAMGTLALYYMFCGEKAAPAKP